MARRILQQLIDDLDGTELADGAGETIRFGVDGTTYEIDLSDDNAKALRAAIAPYVTAGRRASTSARRAPGRDLAAIRVWANSNGHVVSDRGRVPDAVIAAYDAR